MKIKTPKTSAEFFRAFHGYMTVFFIILWGVAIFTGWINSVPYISHLSQAALVYGAFSSWQASRAEVKVDNIDTDTIETQTLKVKKGVKNNGRRK